MFGGYVGHRSGSNNAPGNGSSAMYARTLAFRMRARTAKCQGAQSCLPDNKGISLVEGKEICKREERTGGT